MCTLKRLIENQPRVQFVSCWKSLVASSSGHFTSGTIHFLKGNITLKSTHTFRYSTKMARMVYLSLAYWNLYNAIDDRFLTAVSILIELEQILQRLFGTKTNRLLSKIIIHLNFGKLLTQPSSSSWLLSVTIICKT